MKQKVHCTHTMNKILECRQLQFISHYAIKIQLFIHSSNKNECSFKTKLNIYTYILLHVTLDVKLLLHLPYHPYSIRVMALFFCYLDDTTDLTG